MIPKRVAFVYGVPLGVGGLGTQAANALRALSGAASEVHAIGPGPDPSYDTAAFPNVRWHVAPAARSAILQRTPFRRRAGALQLWGDRHTGRFARARLEGIRPDCCYGFTQVALETLQWAGRAGVRTILESPNGHITSFRAIYTGEAARLCGSGYAGHPTAAMIARVEYEYRLADRIRVSSEWARTSLVEGGVDGQRITCLQQRVDLDRYRPADTHGSPDGPLRVCFVGSLDLRKGFVYLLRAVRRLGSSVTLEMVGATGDRCCRRLLDREAKGLPVRVGPGDPRRAFARAEVFVLPTLEDGSPFATAEAMACAVPVITTTCNGAAEWIRAGLTGWLVEPASDVALADALERAIEHRAELPDMGRNARLDTERRAGSHCDEEFREWIRQ